MQVVILLLVIAVLAGTGIGIFFWKLIRAERKAEHACMYCQQPLSEAGPCKCPHCGLVVCVPCWERRTNCPHCKSAWPRAAQNPAKLAG